jgi:hypothetical protein
VDSPETAAADEPLEPELDEEAVLTAAAALVLDVVVATAAATGTLVDVTAAAMAEDDVTPRALQARPRAEGSTERVAMRMVCFMVKLCFRVQAAV